MIKSIIFSFILGYYLTLHILDYIRQRRIFGYKRRRETDSILFYAMLKPFIVRLSVLMAGKFPRLFKKIDQMLVYAGREDFFTPERFVAYHITLTVLFGTIGFIFGGFWGLFILLFAGLLYPIYWLRKETRKRREEIINNFPNMVDILTLSVEAGLDFISALSRLVARYKKNALTFELGKILSEIKVGLSSGEALRRFSQRCNVNTITSFASLLIQADRLGSSVGPILRVQSDKLRYERFQRAERAGIIAAQKVLIPLIFFIMPAVFIVIFGPILINFVTNGFGFFP